jgi:hypothetical protein
MKAYISAPPLAFPGYCTAELRGLPDCVWELATTHVGIVVLGFSVIIVTRYLRSPWRCVPPGPWGLPILGNAAKLQDKTWLFGQDCKEKYGAFSNSSATMVVTWCLRYRRGSGVLDCSRPAHYRLQ